MSITELQKVITQSAENAKGFSRELFQGESPAAEDVQQFVNAAGTMTIATIDREGNPHAAIVPVNCVDGTLYLGVTPHTALLGNLRRDPRAGFTIDEKVVGQGTTRQEGKASAMKSLAPSLSGVLRSAVEQDWEGYVFSLKPTRLFAALPGD